MLECNILTIANYSGGPFSLRAERDPRSKRLDQAFIMTRGCSKLARLGWENLSLLQVRPRMIHLNMPYTRTPPHPCPRPFLEFNEPSRGTPPPSLCW